MKKSTKSEKKAESALSSIDTAKILAFLNSLLSTQNIVIGGVIWSFATAAIFLLFGSVLDYLPPFIGRLYQYVTYLLETIPYGLAAWLCYRNWKSPQIASGGEVWLSIGIGMVCYVIGNVIFGIWELYFGLNPEISPADLFYMGFTFAIGTGMFLAVLPRRLNLEPKQLLVIGIVALLGITLATWLAFFAAPSGEATSTETEPATEQVLPSPSPSPKATPSPKVTPSSKATPSPKVTPSPKEAPPPLVEESEEERADLPGWVLATNDFLSSFASPVNFFYIFADVALLIAACSLLLAFWGGRFSLSWNMIAAAALAKYIADMWLEYATTLPEQYESGGVLEMFYVFGGVLFGMGAALEYSVSTSRPSRGRRKRK